MEVMVLQEQIEVTSFAWSFDWRWRKEAATLSAGKVRVNRK
jgi:hypothetical protein